MFGYLNIEKDKLEDGQRGLWQTFMCGLCFSTKQLYGNYPRMFISNDVNFFNVLFHSVTNTDVAVTNKRCFSHPIRKRSVLQETVLTDKLSVANVLLTYWNIYDDTIDGGSTSKKIALRSFRKAYRKAKKDVPELDEILAKRYSELRELEQSNCNSIDRVAHAFALLSQDFATSVLGEHATEYVQTLAYNLGKWIYLIDALDDATKDIKRRNYNPFVSCYNVQSAQELSKKYDELQFLMFAVLNRIAQSYNDLNLTKYTCILNNVLFDSIRDKTKQVLNRYKTE
ncbi:MAG: hypothetical protein J1G02_04870 [Clostridiales bacterium]|nr:hypothetical protein [Clostridiales bacterium]